MLRSILSLCLVLSSSFATASDWIISQEQSSLTFQATQTGASFTGHFTEFDISAFFNPATPETGAITATINLASVDASDKQRNTALPTPDWFFIEKFPTATFTANKIVANGNNTFEAHGSLTLRGVSQAIILPFKFKETNGTARIIASTILNRSHYGVGSGTWATGKWVGLDVSIHLSLTAKRKIGGTP